MLKLKNIIKILNYKGRLLYMKFSVYWWY